tara:strand:+ start:9239 stop:10303 length:1065 start_codon:yes stop_codon:yes gene_type:complete
MKNTISILLALIFITSCKENPSKSKILEKNESYVLKGNNLKSIEITKNALYPETILYHSKNEKFIVGSFRDGNIYEIDNDGNAKIFIEANLRSILGIQIDYKHNKFFALSSDIGASINRYNKGLKKEATLNIYNLTTKELIRTVSLAKLKPNSAHLANGLTIDNNGNAYITDSFSPVIYKVDTNGNTSIFLEDNQFVGDGINLNGIVYHPDGYLITVKKSDGTLFKIPISEPEKFSKIELDTKLYGGDGLLILDKNNLAIASNIASGKATESVFWLQTDNDWKSAYITDKKYLGNVYPTTIVAKKNNLYVLHSNLNVLVSSSKEASKAELLKENINNNEVLKKKATIQHIGMVK